MDISTKTLEKIAYESDDPAIIDAVFGAIDNAHGNYDSEKAKDALRKLSASGILDYKNADELKKLFLSSTSKKGEDYDNPPSLSLKDIASKLGYGTTEEMLDGEVPWSKIPYDRYKEEFGERTDEVRDVLKQASMDYAYNVKTPQLRKEAMESKPYSGALKMLFPRMYEAGEQGRSPSQDDVNLDLLENALMAVPTPATGVTGALRLAPRIGGVLARVGEKVGSKAPSMVKHLVAEGVADNALVPAVMEGLDALAYDDANPRGVFNPADVIRGMAVNWITPAILRSRIMNAGARDAGYAGRGANTGVRDMLAKIADPESAVGSAFVSYATNKLGKPEFAKSALSVLGADKYADEIDKAVNEEVEKVKEERRAAKVSDILGGAGLTAEDRKFLKMIKEKPSIVKFGIPGNKDADRFNMWLMTRGNELGVTRPGWTGIK